MICLATLLFKWSSSEHNLFISHVISLLMQMFEIFIFQAGGLVLWPIDCETTRKTIAIVNNYVQRQILEGHSSEEMYVKDKITALTKHDTEHNLFFTITVSTQIAQQISYLSDLLAGVVSKFSFQYERILDQKETMLIPAMFEKFSVEDIIDKYKGTTHKPIPQPEPELKSIENKRPKSVDIKKKDSIKVGQEKRPKSPGRTHYYDKKTEEEAQNSTVIGADQNTAEHIDVAQYDLDDFQDVFAPTQKSASGLSNLFKSIIGEKTIEEADLKKVLDAFEQHLINKNVAAHIAKDLTMAVQQKLIGTKCGNFSSIKTIVTSALKENIERILTPHRTLDLIRDVQNNKAKGIPYTMAFVGVNGVGKSTSLSKVAYLFKSYGFRVLIVACDTYRSGAVDQLKVHCQRLDIDLFQRGGNKKDPVPVARDSITYAKENNYDVILIDTAGRMQNSQNLMEQIARLINTVVPDLTVFVAEALVGNNGSDQIQQFDNKLKQSFNTENARGIDGIILTKFDTIDDKVGAALTLVYETGHPIVFLGVGQHYRDLRRMNPEFVVQTLLNGF